jgi:mediator of RNA polymerase II transcription subunit 12
MPQRWDQFKDTLRSCIERESHLFVVFESLDRRNKRLSTSNIEEIKASPRHRLVQLLDSSLSTPLADNLLQRALTVGTDHSTLARTILQWATSPHRIGVTKVYVGARLLRKLDKLGFDINEAVVKFLGSETTSSSLCKSSLYHLVSELARSGHFSVAHYLQWLIARGGIRNLEQLAEDGPCATRLLAELPTHHLDDNIDELRTTILERAGFSVDEEVERTELAIQSVWTSSLDSDSAMEEDVHGLGQGAASHGTMSIASLSRTSKSEFGLWLRQRVSQQCMAAHAHLAEEMRTSAIKERVSIVTMRDFNRLRAALEGTADFSILADVLKITATVDDPYLLTSIADTVNLHLETFAAIGALNDLFDILHGRLRFLAAQNTETTRPFLKSLSRVALRIPHLKMVAAQLSQELHHLDQKTAAEACSPVSDYMAEALQNSQVDFADEIEKVLESGTSMDQSTLERLFQTIIVRLEAAWGKNPGQQRKCGLLLAKLMIFDPKAFAAMMTVWLSQAMANEGRPNLSTVLGHLISMECLRLDDVLSVSAEFLEKGPALAKHTAAATLALEVLTLVLEPVNIVGVMEEEDSYRLRIMQHHVQKDRPREMRSTIRHAVEMVAMAPEHDLMSQIDHLLNSPNFIGLLRGLVIVDVEGTSSELLVPLVRSAHPIMHDRIRTLISRIMVQNDSEAYSGIVQALKLSDDLTQPFCQLQLRLLFHANDSNDGAPEADKTRMEELDAAITAAVATGNAVWASIVPSLDTETIRHLRQKSETSFLEILPSPRATMATDDLDRIHRAQKLMSTLEATASSIPSNGLPHLGVQIVEKLNDYWALLASRAQSPSIVEHWLPLLLRFIIIHQSVFTCDKAGSESRSRVLLSLTSLFLHCQSMLQEYAGISTLIYDTIILLVDNLTDEYRLICIRALSLPAGGDVSNQIQQSGVAHNPQMKYLFSIPASDFEHLKLECKGKMTEFRCRRWEILSEATVRVEGNDGALDLRLFGGRKG